MFTSSILLYLAIIVFGFIELILALRILLRFLNASTGSTFVRWVYQTSDSLINPFRGMFPNPVLDGGYVIEINTLVALLFYAIVGYLIGEIVAFLRQKN